jgi:ligand-binding sensor domain-containing protein
VGILQIGFGILLLVGLTGLVQRTLSRPALPPGWTIICPPHEVSALAVQGNIIWAGGEDGVVGLDISSGEITATLKCDLPLSHVRALLIDHGGTLWIGHFAGLSRYTSAGCHTYTRRDGLPDDRVNALYLDQDGRLWVGTWSGAAFRQEEGWHVLTSADGLADNMVNVIFQDRQGGMWFGSYVAPRGGLSHCKDGHCQEFSINNGLPHNNITSLLEDQAGNIWVGTGFYDRGGAARLALTESGWAIQQVLTAKDGLAGEKVYSIFQDHDGVLWFGSEYNGLARLENGHWRVLTEKDGLSNPEVKAIAQDGAGNLWLATYDGITRVSARALDDLRQAAQK